MNSQFNNQFILDEANFILKYNSLIILKDNSIKRALHIPLNELRKAKVKGTEKMMPFLFTRNPHNPNIFRIIKPRLH